MAPRTMMWRRAITSLFRRWERPGPPDYTNVVHVNSMADVPEDPGNSIYIVAGEQPKWVILDCPCKQGHRLSVPLMKSVKPNWRLSLNNGRVSLWPSISVRDACHSHFWLERNSIHWARWRDE